jgi:hypothetical protein
LFTDISFDLIDYGFVGYNDPAYGFGRVLGNYDSDSEVVPKIFAAYFGRPATSVEHRYWVAYIALHNWYNFCWSLYKESTNMDTWLWMHYFYV